MGWFGVGPAPLATPPCYGEGLGLAFSLICWYDGWTRAQCHILRSGTARYAYGWGVACNCKLCAVRSLSGARFPHRASLTHR
jgi:hypothetical protein